MRTPQLKLDPPIAGSSDSIARLKELIRQLADVSANILITGESGTGKELVAKNLHSCGPRRNGPFVAVNCTALSPGILESELFGHGRGSFTGAVQAHAGVFEQADGGTLFLDEIGDISSSVQSKLLRVIQSREVRRMGASHVRRVDVRLVSATNADLETKVRDGTFRLDLFYRLNVVEVSLVPLREHRDDIMELIDFFFASRGIMTPEVPNSTRDVLFRYPWPGNVRELENELERIIAFQPDVTRITPDVLSGRVLQGPSAEDIDVACFYETSLPQAVGYLEENLLRKMLLQNNWNKSQAARKLGLSRQGLLKKIKRYGITEGA